MIIEHFDRLQCKDCSDIQDKYYIRGLLRFIFDDETRNIIGLKCPDCGKIFLFSESTITETFECRSCHDLFFERSSDIGRELCSECVERYPNGYVEREEYLE